MSEPVKGASSAHSAWSQQVIDRSGKAVKPAKDAMVKKAAWSLETALRLWDVDLWLWLVTPALACQLVHSTKLGICLSKAKQLR